MRSRLADYQILGPAGPDVGPGRSWLAQPPDRLGEPGPVVVTEIDDVTDASWPAVARRLRDLASVRSDHLPGLLEAGRGDDAGVPLAWLSRRGGSAQPLASLPRSPRQTLHLLAGAALGAHHLHEAGLVHGDIRPTSVLVDSGTGILEPPVRRQALLGSAVLRVSAPMDLDGVEADAVWGRGPSRASDVYAIGAAAHSLLTGRPVHPALTGDQVVTAVQRVLVERPVLDPSLPAPMADVLRSCLAADPADRPESAEVLAGRFESLAEAS